MGLPPGIFVRLISIFGVIGLTSPVLLPRQPGTTRAAVANPTAITQISRLRAIFLITPRTTLPMSRSLRKKWPSVGPKTYEGYQKHRERCQRDRRLTLR